MPECDIPAPGLVTVEAPDLCRRYIGRVIRNVKVGPSPKWLVERLESSLGMAHDKEYMDPPS